MVVFLVRMVKKITGEGVVIKMDVGTRFEAHRFRTFYTKEPETISWIKELFKPGGDVFFDIGANVGVYSLFAAAFHKGRVRVFAFEPAYHNFSKLCRNIDINGFNKVLMPYPTAIGDKTRFEKIDLASTISGSAMHSMEGGAEHSADSADPAFSQGVFSATIDDMISKFGFPCPTHIKIDTDGFEEHVIYGAKTVLKNKSVRSILIEVNSANSKERIEKTLTDYGFTGTHPINFQQDHSRIRRRKSGKSVENVIFTR